MSRARLLQILFSTASIAVLIQTGAALAQTKSSGSEEVIVTGTRQSDRTVADSPVPIDVINADALTSQGPTDTNKILSNLVPSLNFPAPALNDGTDTVRPVTLRGLSPDDSLVLVNGKRWHPSALLNVNGSIGRGSSAVDMNTIPSLGIQRVEVLRDGAAAQYGSDAIGGVINVIMKNASQGASLTVTGGEYVTEPDGMQQNLGVVTNANGQPVPNALLPQPAYQIKRGGQVEINDGATETVTGNIGLPLTEKGFVNLTLEFKNQESTNRADADPRQQYNLVGGLADPRELTINRTTFDFGSPKVESWTGFLNSGFDISSDIHLYAFGSYQLRHGASFAFWRQPDAAANIPSIYPNGFLPLELTKNKDISLAAGLRDDDLAGWTLDASVMYGSNRIDDSSSNTLNPTLGPSSPHGFYGGALQFSEFVTNVDISRPVTFGFLSAPAILAFGVEYRPERYQVKAGEPGSYIDGGLGGAGVAPGAQGALFFQPSNAIVGTRNSWSLYSEFDADVTSAWNVQLAARGEQYSDFGSTLNGKFATKYQITDDLALRGAISSGFRAPDLAQEFFTSTVTNFINGVPNQVGTFPVSSRIAQVLGATPLKPEKSVNYSTGLVFKAGSEFYATLDGYIINITDRVLLSENLTALSTGVTVQSVLTANGINGVNSARFFINGADTRTQGVDLTGVYHPQWDVIPGDLQFTGGLNWNETDITKRIAQVGPIAQTDASVLFGRANSLLLEQGTPKTRIHLAGDWRLGAFAANLNVNRYGSVLSPGTTAATDVHLNAKIISDLAVSYDVLENATLSIGADNVFDVYPTRSPIGLNPAGQLYAVSDAYLPYPSISPFGFNGRYLYGRLSLKF